MYFQYDKKLVGDKEDEDTAAASDAAALYEKAEDDCILKGDKNRKEEKETHRIEQPSKIKLAAKNDNPDTDDADDTPSEAHRYPGLLGSATHKLMEMFVTSGKTIDLDIAIDEIVREYMRPVYKGYESDLRKALNDVASRMLSGGYEQDNGLPTDILTTLLEADEVYCEVPFTYEDTSDSTPVIWNGSIDVLYSSGGQWHIIDYKTNADGSDLDDKYQGQLNAYQKALKASTGIDADAKTYHIDI